MADVFSKRKRSQIMAAIRGKHTRPEMIVRRAAHALGFRYRLHVRSLPGTPDLVFPAKRKIIEVRGCFWHAHRCQKNRPMPATNRAYWRRKIEANKARDARTSRALRRRGWQVLVVWECQTRDAAALKSRLRAFLDG